MPITIIIGRLKQNFFYTIKLRQKNIMSSCKKCGEEYIDVVCNWCKPCQIGNLKVNFTNWTSGNGKIDDFIQKVQLKIESPQDIVFEWIPYNQFRDIKEIGKDTVYSAI